MSITRRITLLALAFVLAASACLVAACAGPTKAQIAQQQKDECFATQRQIKLATDLVHADSGIYPDITSVVAQLKAKCPAGGTYSFDPATDTVSCTVHGSAPANSGQ